MTRTISVMIVDDHDLIRVGLRRILQEVPGIKVIGEVKSGEEALQLAREIRPEVVLMDLKMSGMDGLEATQKLLRFDPNIKVLVVTSREDDVLPSLLLKAGALGYMTKGAGAEEMILAIKTVYQGQRYISSNIAKQMALKELGGKSESPFDMLSERELQIMLMVIDGKSAQEISEKLFISPKTVNAYRYRIFEKLKIKSDVELTLLAVRYGLLEDNNKL